MVLNGNYGDHSFSRFTEGCVGDIYTALFHLSDTLASSKSTYDQNIFIIYRLIDQLNTPIAVFNQFSNLVYFNEAFSSIYEVNPHTKVKPNSSALGLQKIDGTWEYASPSGEWEIRHSTFVTNEDTHELLVFVNISSPLREKELSSWNNVIRVLTHEINNSLTPISTLSGSLSDRVDDPRHKQALLAIRERCHHLRDFVARYSTVVRPFKPTLENVNLNRIVHRISYLYPEVIIEKHDIDCTVIADPALIDQVFINLIQNAKEAGAENISLTFTALSSGIKIDMTDDGSGISNIDNIFVPLYTTKKDGQGIGLSFCKNIINEHHGSISVKNNAEKGVTFTIFLPCSQKNNELLTYNGPGTDKNTSISL